MDHFSNRTIIGLAAGFVGASLFVFICIQAFAATTTPPRCTCQDHVLTCAPAQNS
jgi:hypothetical protein